MTNKKKNKSAARVRYEQSHPVISFRVNRELYDRLKTAKDIEGMSEADIVRIGLGMLEPIRKSEKQIWQEAYHKGQLSGYELAESEYKTTYLCIICGKPIEVTTNQEKGAIATYMREHRWGHADCIDRRH